MNRPSVLALLHLWGRLAARPPSRVVELALDMLRAHEKAENRNHTDAANPSVTAAPCHLHSQGDGDSHVFALGRPHYPARCNHLSKSQFVTYPAGLQVDTCAKKG